jgi:hypothetical protein
MPTVPSSHPPPRLGTLAAGLLSLAAGGCVGFGQPRYDVHRSARVLPPLPSMRSAAPMADPIELSTSTGVVTVAEPNGHDSGNRVSRTWIDGAMRLRISSHGDIALLGEAAPASPSIRVSDDQMPAVDKGIPFAFGAGLRTRIGERRGMNVGLGLDILRHSVPVAQIATCVPSSGGWFDTPCPSGSESSTSYSGRSSTGMLRLGIVPTWAGERVTWFGGVSLRTAHWVPREERVQGAPDAVELEIGWSAVLAAGADIPLGDRLRLQAMVAQPLGDPGAAFGPLVSLGLTFGVAPGPSRARPQPSPPPPPRAPASKGLSDLRRACLAHTSAYWRQYDAERRREVLAAMPPACRALIDLRPPR